MTPKLGIIIPVYNEGPNIKATLDAIEQKVKTSHRIYIVYDFDEDDTLPAAMEMQRKGLAIELMKNPVRGVAGAIKTGLQNAPDDFLLVTMADLSDDYSVVDRMCEMMTQGCDLVCGARYMKGGKQIGGPVFKKFLSSTAGLSLKYITSLPVHDITNSFKLYRKSIFGTIDIQSDAGFEIGMEIAVKAHFSGYKVAEVPCTWTDRQDGRSKFKIMKWLPKYLRWYFYALRKNLTSRNPNHRHRTTD
ncbi:MAG: glycosyltransferase [Candidatus Brocadiia bacterium]|nr:MAG: glycosyltransferase [Candidatus Brocadiia bacterium]